MACGASGDETTFFSCAATGLASARTRPLNTMLENIRPDHIRMKDLNEFGKMNEVYGTYFKNAPPARATVEVARLPRDVKVEISAIAVHP